MATKVIAEKKVDLPPQGPRNPDPINGAPGAHPIEAGVGAAVIGAAAGAGVGAVAGPVGTVIGAAVGGIAGGFAGKAVGEMIDPTIDDTWLRDNFSTRPYVQRGDTFEKYEPAYRYGGEAECENGACGFEQIEGDLEDRWNARMDKATIPWKHARSAVKDGYDRTVQIRRGRDIPEEVIEVDELDD